MDTPTGHQEIHCSVSSCAYNKATKLCDLKGIQVSATPYGSSGKACDESMCASYKSQG